MIATHLWVIFLCPGLAAPALDVDFSSVDSIKSAAALVAEDLMSFYHGDEPGKTPGILPGPPPEGDYYWWQGGAMWGTLIDYWHATGDETYNDEIQRSLIFQSGEQHQYEPKNWTASLGNDDQGFWGFSAMLAAETNFQNPPQSDPQYLALAQAVFNRQSLPERHDDACGGGMRWQIPAYNVGYDYKNTIANGCYFNIGARLARYTDNSTYSELAEDTWNWIAGVDYIDEEWNVFDGGHVDKNCTDVFKAQFSYNAGVLLQGAAYMYNHTGDEKWKTRLDGLTERTLTYFFERKGSEGIMFEASCEEAGQNGASTCNTDMLSFKGYLHRWLADAIKLAPHLRSTVYPALVSSAQAAVKQCTGGSNGRMCGFHWASGTWDGNVGAGQQMNVLGALTSLLVDHVPSPVTADNGGTSQGDPLAGTDPDPPTFSTVTKGDIAGASFLTVLITCSTAAAIGWMATDYLENIKF
ncbi:hypothetical protein MKZ38_005430 [Zalerion maritima]|uniref:Mannan endo-1,6-alpha-mannosidase n=1 Tax=Zalerion maritima TaxID=339359 RepID=A0AAD5RQZ9_9PEZI|nr:hypothetical protein MKZ38_005430 [Zalerion maritima]